MKKQTSPGRWIAAAALSAVLVVMVAMPGKKPERPVAVTPVHGTEATNGTKEVLPPDQPASVTSEPSVASVPSIPSNPALPRDPDDPIPAAKPITPADRDNTLRVLDNIQFALRDYRSALGENPVGTNAEITSSLLGNNRKQAKVPLPEGANVNAAGEMLDLWGTPYFFHQQSATKMEIRSAGPDRKMWTPDDLGM